MKHADFGSIVAFRNDRLGARLNALLTAMRISETYDAKLRVFWAVSENSSVELQHPEELFSEAFIEKHFTTRSDGSRLLKEATDIGMIRNLSQDEFRNSLKSGESYLSNSATEQIILPWETQAALDCLPRLIGKIDFQPKVREMIDRIDGTDVAFKSYHLRRGDIINDAVLASHNLWPDKYIPRVIYEWHMKRELSHGDGALVIFSDAQAEAAAFSSLSPRVKSFDDLIGEADLTPLQRDFLELYAMSRSQSIFAPPSSAFSQMAAVIGNKKVVDIEADLSPQDRTEALDELAHRLETTPEVFLSQSDAGQNFPFIAGHLEASGQGERVNAIAMGHIESGMDRAYIYPFLSERLLTQGDYEGCDRLVDILSDRLSYREEHWSTVYLHAAMADMIRGNWDRAIKRFNSGSWFFPINRLASETFWYLTAIGQMTPFSGYPYDPSLMRRTRTIYSEGSNPAGAILMEHLNASGIDSHQYPANMEVRDWQRVHGKKLSFRFSNLAKIAQQADFMEQNMAKGGAVRRPGFQSAIGALLSKAGKFDRAEAYLQEALQIRPDEPLYLKRYADHLVARERPDAALPIYEQAWRLSCGHPCYQAELALAWMDHGDNDRYIGLMAGLVDADHGLIEIRLQIGEALRRKNKFLPDARRYVDELQRDAPGSLRVRSLLAKVLEQSGEWDEAMRIILEVQKMGRPETVIRRKLESLYRSYRRAHDDTSAKAWLNAHGVSFALDA